jgi:chorismate-pyruvate lyase
MIAGRLAARHFKAQGRLPEDLTGVELGALDPFLRNLLVTDGTVSRSLEAHTLRPIVVEPVEQSETLPPQDVAADLQLDPDEACMRRRVVMRINASEPSVWAESYVVPRRAPTEFLRALRDNDQGIGGSLEKLRLESWRELLWFGLGRPPEWPAESSTEQTLRRAYLLLIGGSPSLLIGEHFAVTERDGRYALAGADAWVGEEMR